MKKYLALFLVIFICLPICACNNDVFSGDLPETSTNKTEMPTETEAETSAETETETEFVPTEDNVIWGIADIVYSNDGDPRSELISLINPCEPGEIYVQRDVLEAMKVSGDKRIAIEYYYIEDPSAAEYPSSPLPIEIPDEYKMDPTGKGYFLGDTPEYAWTRHCFLTADEIVDLILAVEERQLDYPKARLSIISFTKHLNDTGIRGRSDAAEEDIVRLYPKNWSPYSYQ